MNTYENTYHADGTITYWNVYRQNWERRAASDIPDRVLASMRSDEREKIQDRIALYWQENRG